MDYKQKYLKYKAKYLKLKGGNPPEETDFTNELKFRFIARGQQGTVYNLIDTNYAYKVFRGITQNNLGMWAKPLIIGGDNYYGGIKLDVFNKIAERYKKASDLGLGPHFYKCYTYKLGHITDGVIVMEYINGETIRNLRREGRITPEIERRYNDLCNELYKNDLIDSDSHEDNFMVDNDTGRVYGIDF